MADSASIEKVIDQNELRNTYNYYMMTPKSLRRRKKRFSETRTEREVVNVRLDGVYLSNPSLYTSQNATTEMVKMDLSSDLGLMRNGTDSLDSFLLERRLMKGRASGKGGGGHSGSEWTTVLQLNRPTARREL